MTDKEIKKLRQWSELDYKAKELEERLAPYMNDYPFNEGDDYWIIEDGVVTWSCWDSESEEIHDQKPGRQYFKSSEDAFKEIKNK